MRVLSFFVLRMLIEAIRAHPSTVSRLISVIVNNVLQRRGKTILPVITIQELIQMRGVIRAASQLKVRTVLEDLLRLCRHERRL